MALKKYMTPEQMEAALIKVELENAAMKEIMKKTLKGGGDKAPKSAWENFMYGEDTDPEPILSPEDPPADPSEDLPANPPEDPPETE